MQAESRTNSFDYAEAPLIFVQQRYNIPSAHCPPMSANVRQCPPTFAIVCKCGNYSLYLHTNKRNKIRNHKSEIINHNVHTPYLSQKRTRHALCTRQLYRHRRKEPLSMDSALSAPLPRPEENELQSPSEAFHETRGRSHCTPFRGALTRLPSSFAPPTVVFTPTQKHSSFLRQRIQFSRIPPQKTLSTLSTLSIFFEYSILQFVPTKKLLLYI